jgi:hypothetical protein
VGSAGPSKEAEAEPDERRKEREKAGSEVVMMAPPAMTVAMMPVAPAVDFLN